MNIRTKLRVTASISIVTAVVVGVVMFLSLQKLNAVRGEADLILTIREEVSALQYVTFEYLTYNEQRMYRQWLSKHANITKLLDGLRDEHKEAGALIEEIRQHHKDMGAIFDRMTGSLREAHGNGSLAADQARPAPVVNKMRIILGGQLLLRTQYIISDLLRLSAHSRSVMADAQKKMALAVVLSVLILVAVIAVASLTIMKSLVKPVDKLRRGTERVGAGDLDFRIGTNRDDEIGQLSRSFDAMAEELGRKKKTLSEVQARLAHILAATPTVVYACRIPEGGESGKGYPPTFVSDMITDLFGYEPKEILENPAWWLENLHPEDKAKILNINLLFESGEMSREYRFRTKDGSYRWVLDQSVLVRDGEGAPVEFVGSWVDITERKRAEEQIQKGLKLETALRRIDKKILEGSDFREALDIACEAVVDMGYRMCWIGQAMPDHTVQPVASRGFNQGYLENMDIRWDESPEGNGPTGISIRTGQPCVIQNIGESPLYAPWRDIALEHGYLSSASFPLKTGEREVVGVLHVYRDRVGAFRDEDIGRLGMFAQQCTIAVLSARRLEELRDTSQRLTFHVNRMPLGYIVWDKDFRVTEWNPAAERIFGWESDEALGKHPYELIVPAEAQLHVDQVWSKLLEGDQSSYSLNDNIRKDGKTITCEWFNTPLWDARGNIMSVLSMVHDVTEKTKMEKQFLMAQKMESVGTLAGGIAHDFNNALTGIVGFGELLRQKLSGDEHALHDLDEIQRCAERASTLTRQLLTYARRQVIEPVNLSLNTLTADLMKLISKVAGEHIEIRTFLSKGLPTIRADRGQIEQVLMNLCLNARDAMPKGGQLLVETEEVYLDEEYVKHNPYIKAGRYALLKVSDTGIGMNEKTRERVFEPFFTTKGPDKGTGLGLAMVYGIVKQHNGYIHLYSELGKGTTFKVYFPAVEALPDAVLETRREETVRGGTETILLAEDEESVRGLAERVLEDLGYKVLVARNGEEAIEIFRQNEDIALAVLDVIMPRKGGKEAYEEMHKANPKLKVIFMSGYSANAIHESFVLIAGVPFLPKPFGPSSLAKKVREVLDRQ